MNLQEYTYIFLFIFMIICLYYFSKNNKPKKKVRFVENTDRIPNTGMTSDLFTSKNPTFFYDDFGSVNEGFYSYYNSIDTYKPHIDKN